MINVCIRILNNKYYLQLNQFQPIAAILRRVDQMQNVETAFALAYPNISEIHTLAVALSACRVLTVHSIKLV